MIFRSAKGRNSVYWLFSIFILNCCSSAVKKNPPKLHIVEIKEMRFEPAELIVRKGDTAVWVNYDLVAHDVTEYPGKAWTSSPIQKGGSWRMAVTQSIGYHCNIHQVMKGKIVAN